MSWGNFKDENGRPLRSLPRIGVHGSYEVFHVSECDEDQVIPPGDLEPLAPGWYWWACFPGCLPDGEPVGPFKTEAEARVDAETVL